MLLQGGRKRLFVGIKLGTTVAIKLFRGDNPITVRVQDGELGSELGLELGLELGFEDYRRLYRIRRGRSNPGLTLRSYAGDLTLTLTPTLTLTLTLTSVESVRVVEGMESIWRVYGG